MGPGRVMGSTRYSTPPGPTLSHTPGTPLPYPASALATAAPRHVSVNEVVGLKSVAQLTLGDYISDLRTITEVYNLAKIGDR